MPDEVTVEEVLDDQEPTSPALPDTPPEGWGEAIKGWVKDVFTAQTPPEEQDVAKGRAEALAMAAKVLTGAGIKVSAAQLARQFKPGRGAPMMPEEEDDEEMANKKNVKKEEGLPEAVLPDLVKAEVAAIRDEYAGVLDEVKKSNQALVEQNAALEKSLANLRQERDLEKGERRRIEAINKAETLRRLPLPSTDLAELLTKAEDGLEPAAYQQLESLLKATDRQLYQAGLFAEFGHSRSPEQVTLEDKVAKAAAGGTSYTDALLDLSPEEQAELLQKWDEQGGAK